MKEEMIWKPIKKWESLYKVNQYGDVMNIKTNNLIIGDDNGTGYKRATLYNGDVHKKYYRHRLVAEHFLDNPNNLEEVNHIDSDKGNNYYKNLEWVNRKKNKLHAMKNGKEHYRPFEVQFFDNRTVHYDSASDLAKEIGVSKTMVRNWLNKKYKSYHKYKIKAINDLKA